MLNNKGELLRFFSLIIFLREIYGRCFKGGEESWMFSLPESLTQGVEGLGLLGSMV